MDANEMMWATAAEDVTAERNLRVYSLAKVAAQQAAWAFLSAALSPSEYDARFELVADRVSDAVAGVSAGDTALLDQVRTSLKEDHALLVESRRRHRMQELAEAWADDTGPIHSLATTGTTTELLGDEIEALGALVGAAERAELAELHRLALGREPNFSRRAAIDPSDVPYEFNEPAYNAGREDGYYNDNAGLEEYGHHPDYQRGREAGQDDVADEKMRPNEYNAAVKTSAAHPPYYITESGGQFKVVDAIGEVRGTFDSKDAARQQQKALYANVPGAADKAEDKHGDPRPKAVQEQGKKPASKAAAVDVDDYPPAPYDVKAEGTYPMGGWMVTDASGSPVSYHQGHSGAVNAMRDLMINHPDPAVRQAAPEHAQSLLERVNPFHHAAFERGPWMMWSGHSLYDVHGNKLGGVRPVERGSEQHHAIVYRPRGEQPALPVVMGTHPSRDAAKAHVEQMFGKTMSEAAKTAEYHYIRQNGDKWEIFQKGTGKTLSTHDSKEKAEEAFRAMMMNKHQGALRVAGYSVIYTDTRDGQQRTLNHPTTGQPYNKQETAQQAADRVRSYGVAAPDSIKVVEAVKVAVNEDAYGADRYQHTPAPTVPSWVHDEFLDHDNVPLGDTPVKNNADGNELKPTAPWLVREESRTTPPMANTTSASSANLTWTVPSTWTITANNPFFMPGPGNPGSTMPAPNDDPNQVGLTPDALDPSMNPSADAGLPNPALGDSAAADGTNLMPMPSPSDDLMQANNPAVTGGRYAAPMEMVDRIAAEVLASHPELPLRQCVAIATQTLQAHPELVAA